MVEAQVTLLNPSGLHARPAAQFTQMAGRFKATKINIIKEGREIDSKSILGVMSLGLPCGSIIAIRAEGPDETEAVTSLVNLVKNGFDEL